MSFLKKLFGGKPSRPSHPPPRLEAPPVPKDPLQDPNMIRVFDAYGREMFITRQAWLDQVLPGNIAGHWNDPEQLSNLIIQSFSDGFFEQMVKPAERLREIDPNHERAAVLLGIVYLKVKRLSDSEKALQAHMQQYGESGVALTNLAKVYADRGDEARSTEVLWRGLQLDPNQDNAVSWYEAIHRQKGGGDGSDQALRRIAGIPKSWRPQLWLARAALKRRDLAGALKLYEESLAAAPQPILHDLLGQMSGDLGNAGHLPELINLTLPRFDVTVHGLQVGNNLIKAMVDLGQIENAQKILKKLYAQNRPDWKPTLSFWDTEIAKMRVETSAVPSPEELRISMLTIEGPVWLPEQSPAQELFPAASADAVGIAFLGSSAEMPDPGSKPTHQMSDPPGRLSRAIPLFLAEQVCFGANADVRTLIPWLHAETGAFVFSGVPWREDDAAQYARMGEKPCDYVVVTHLKVKAEPWRVELRVIRTIDAKLLGTAACSFPMAQPAEGLQSLAQQLLVLLVQHAEVTTASAPAAYQVPRGAEFPYYLLRLEQLVAVRCAGIEGVPAGFLSGAHEIVDGNLHLCLNNPKSVSTRILLLQTCRAMKRPHPEVVAAFRDKMAQLQREHPLAQPAQSIAERLLTEALAQPTR